MSKKKKVDRSRKIEVRKIIERSKAGAMEREETMKHSKAGALEQGETMNRSKAGVLERVLKKQHFAIVGFLSFTLLGMELIWTRIYSAEFFYTFAFLILSLAILGLGMGALTVRLYPKLNKIQKINLYLIMTALSTLLCPPATFLLNLDFAVLFSIGMLFKTAFAIIILALPYFFGGMILAILFKRYIADISRLYMVDLISAGMGVAAAIVLMQYTGTPSATFLMSIPLIVAIFLNTDKKGKKYFQFISSAILSGLFIVLVFNSEKILEAERKEPAPVISKHWDAMSKIKIYQYNDMYKGINIDNHASTTVVGFDGNFNRPDSMIYDFFGINVGYLIRRFDKCKFLAIGAGGGKDVMHALFEGAAEVYATEVNPYINYLMTEGELAGFTGYIYRDPRVNVITEDARTYVRRFKNKFDIIFSFSSNSYAALASGAFALAENYIYTKEAFIDYWNALSSDGFIVMEHHFYIPRLVSETIAALKDLRIKNINSHFAVYNLPEWKRQLLLISKKPLSDKIMQNAIGELSPQNHNMYLIYPAPLEQRNNLIYKIVQSGWENVIKDSPIDISPSTDDRPFTPQLGLWKNFGFDRLKKVEGFEEFFGFPLAKLVILMILGVVLVLAIPLVMLPYIKSNKKLKPTVWLYFFCIGAAFIIIEVILIQKYTLFIGPSVYSASTVLLTLLILSGIGSRISEKLDYRLAFAGIIVFLLLDIFLYPVLTNALSGIEMLSRVLVSSLMVAPLGFFMGMPFPKGAKLADDLVDWGFAVNGVASVLGSAIIVLIAFIYGFTVSLIIAGILYLLSFIFYRLSKVNLT